jgi:hypothetical protein
MSLHFKMVIFFFFCLLIPKSGNKTDIQDSSSM